MFIVDKLNASIEKDDEDEQNMLSVFLDETITDILEEWLEDLKEYKIYPGHEESSDNFPTEKIFTIMQRILETTVRRAAPVVLPAVTLPPAELHTLHDPEFIASIPVPEPKPEPEPVAQQEQEHIPEPEPEPVPKQEPEPVPPKETVATALRRRRTMKLRPADRSSAGKTRNRRKFPVTR